jgi:hypothetical protein
MPPGSTFGRKKGPTFIPGVRNTRTTKVTAKTLIRVDTTLFVGEAEGWDRKHVEASAKQQTLRTTLRTTLETTKIRKFTRRTVRGLVEADRIGKKIANDAGESSTGSACGYR